MDKGFNYDLNEERHENVTKEFKSVWRKLDKFDIRIWGILVLQFGILGGVLALIFKYKP